MFLMGRVTTSDSTAIPNDAIVERICNGAVRQQVHAALNGQSTYRSQNDSFLDATGDPASRGAVNSQNSETGISRQTLANCELRASVSGFSSSVINLVDLAGSLSSIDVGTIVVQRRTKVAGLTLNASSYNAPKDARKAYEKGLVAQKKGELPMRKKYFGKAVEIPPQVRECLVSVGDRITERT